MIKKAPSGIRRSGEDAAPRDRYFFLDDLHARGSSFDPTATPIAGAAPRTAETRSPAVVGKWGINATKPAPHRPERRDFERAWPIGGGGIHLEDYIK